MYLLASLGLIVLATMQAPSLSATSISRHSAIFNIHPSSSNQPCLSFALYQSLFLNPPVFLSVTISLSIYLFVYLPFYLQYTQSSLQSHLFVFLPIPPFISLSLIHSFISLSIHLFLSLSPTPLIHYSPCLSIISPLSLSFYPPSLPLCLNISSHSSYLLFSYLSFISLFLCTSIHSSLTPSIHLSPYF